MLLVTPSKLLNFCALRPGSMEVNYHLTSQSAHQGDLWWQPTVFIIIIIIILNFKDCKLKKGSHNLNVLLDGRDSTKFKFHDFIFNINIIFRAIG